MEGISSSTYALKSSYFPVKRLTVTPTPATRSMDLMSSNASPTLSLLARQLGESDVRADTRDKALTRAELCSEGNRLIAQLVGQDYQDKKQQHDNEIPETQEPELLARARRATEYLAKLDQRDRSVTNPFSGFTRNQLDLIVYDESGSYTVNERRAAYYGVLDMESRWNRHVMHIYAVEGAAGLSNRPRCCSEILAHYRTLPAIEQAEYAPDYESRLEAQINETPDQREGLDKPLTLFDVLARHWRFKKVERTTSGVGIGNSS